MPRRQTFACSRCYKRKKRCDAKLPACSNCKAVGVKCVGIDRESEHDVPRSIVHFLEQSIAEKEIEIAASKDSITFNATSALGSLSGSGCDSTLLGGVESATIDAAYGSVDALLEVTIDARKVLSEVQAFKGQLTLPYLNVLLSESHLPTPLCRPVAGDELQIRAVAKRKEPPLLPDAVARKLFDVYLERILPQYPFFLRDDLQEIFDSVRNPEQASLAPPPCNSFIVYQIMAITTMTSKATDSRRTMSLAESLHAGALNYISSVLARSSLRTIQCLLLLVQLAFLLPHTGDLAHLVNEAMRMSIELGLHQGNSGCSERSPATVELRRKVFWATYALERSVSILGHRCFAIRDENIEVEFPSAPATTDDDDDDDNDNNNNNGEQSPDTRDHIRFFNTLRSRQIQSEISGVQFCNKSFTNPSYADWVVEMDQMVLDWRSQAVNMSDNLPDWFDFGTWYSVLMLHRPCLPNPSPDADSTIACFTATENLVGQYWENSRNQRSKFPWHTVHNCFEAGIVLLYNIGRSPELFTSEAPIGVARSLDVLNRISNIFYILSERWPAAWKCGEFYDMAKKETLRSLFNVPGASRLNIASSIQKTLDDIVLRRPGDTQYVKFLEGMFESKPPTGDDGFSESWWNASFPWGPSRLTNPNSAGFDFAAMVMEFDDLDWTYTTANAPVMVPLDQTLTGLELPTMSFQAQIPSSSSSSESPVAETWLSTALEQLPPCRHCRKRRTKCDRLLPSCRQCVKSGQDCMFWDAVLGQDTPRSYVYALKQRYDSLNAILEQNHAEKHQPNPLLTAVSSYWGSTMDSAATSRKYASRPKDLTAELQRPVEVSSQVGLISVVKQMSSLTMRMTSLGTPITFPTAPSMQGVFQSIPLPTPRSVSSVLTSLPTRDVTENIALQYYHGFELFYPVLGLEGLNEAIDLVYNRRSADQTENSQSITTIYLMLAIMTRVSSKKESRLAEWSRALFDRALLEFQSLGSKLGYPSASALRLNLLLCWYLWLDPASGNIWRLTGQSARAAMDLRGVLNSGDGGTWEEWIIYTTLFRMER
ncbi:hypothetical protein A1O1_02775 [Capronia coronata CBS 617.96]|uniref:Zn(2)-C6 fungal-type domain-containing protein n=1 Tax=Capronia coronata CBS 617.96 TaxID=1182541 RepID=W9YYP1_9EURO|nr:uncharacterized protein A1O1_02775 [Capronia coronata CBS 617.96]EXJ94381.1 hypothetical protein A1O1_02775 [Capronia coronata CBS 617.96]